MSGPFEEQVSTATTFCSLFRQLIDGGMPQDVAEDIVRAGAEHYFRQAVSERESVVVNG